MLCLSQRVRLLKTSDLPAVRYLAVAVLLCCSVQEIRTAAAQGNPATRKPSVLPKPRITSIATYVTWLDEETIILALRNPATKRIVVGIAKLSQTEAGLGVLTIFLVSRDRF
jgi:hypothetical protein